MKKNSLTGALLLLLMIVLFFLLLPATAISLRGMREDLFEADAAVVFGNEVYADGTPAPRLAARLDRAVELYNGGMCKKIIASGGVGESGFDEALGMARYLESKGIPPDDIVADSEGVNTRATANFTGNYMRENGLYSVLAVTQYFHVPRSVMALKESGIERIGSAYARYFEPRDILSTFREVPAVFAYSLGLK